MRSPRPLMLRGQLATRRRADEFARLLDGAQPVESPDAYAALAEYAPSVALTRQLASAGRQALAPIAAPRAEFRTALRTRLLAVATVPASSRCAAPAVPTIGPTAHVRWRTRPVQRAVGVAAGTMASVLAIGGVAVAGSQSLPGDPFYNVKRTAEDFQLTTADGDLAKGRRHLDFAATRLRELRGLALGRDAYEAPLRAPSDPGDTSPGSAAAVFAVGDALDPKVAQRLRETLADMDAETRMGSVLLTGAFLDSQAPATLQALSQFATRQSDGLERLLPALPPESQDRAVASLALVAGVADETDDLLEPGACPPVCDPPTSAPSPPVVQSPSADPAPSVSGTPTPTATAEPQVSASASASSNATPGPSPTAGGASPRPERPASPAPSATASPTTVDEPRPEPFPVPIPSMLPFQQQQSSQEQSSPGLPFLPLPPGLLQVLTLLDPSSSAAVDQEPRLTPLRKTPGRPSLPLSDRR
ncbi:MAG: DUF5667 domain-containing protein [Mycobacteriales bacterium]